METALPKTALLLVLGSALLHAAWNTLLKRCEDKAAGALLLQALSVVFGLAVGVIVGGFALSEPAVPWLILCSFIEAAYFATLAGAMARLPLGTAYGLSRGGGLLMVWPLSHLVFGEGADLLDGVGVVLLSGGLFLWARGAPDAAGLRWAAACATTIATYPVVYKQALAAGADPYALFAGAIGLSVPTQAWALGAGRWGRLRRSIAKDTVPIVLGGALCTASFLVFLVVLRNEGPGRVTALRNASVLFTTAFAWKLGEERTVRSGVSALAVAAGCLLVA